jgi:hypothetical protein
MMMTVMTFFQHPAADLPRQVPVLAFDSGNLEKESCPKKDKAAQAFSCGSRMPS